MLMHWRLHHKLRETRSILPSYDEAYTDDGEGHARGCS